MIYVLEVRVYRCLKIGAVRVSDAVIQQVPVGATATDDVKAIGGRDAALIRQDEAVMEALTFGGAFI